MGKDVRVFVYDDLDPTHQTEAQHTNVPLAFGRTRVVLDLSDASHKKLAGFLAPYLAAGTREDQVNPGDDHRVRRPRVYYAGLRKWLEAEHGITLEPDASGKMAYPPDLRRDYDRLLVEGKAGL
jgi:hypothetical protein